jgi:hypothetical protein
MITVIAEVVASKFWTISNVHARQIQAAVVAFVGRWSHTPRAVTFAVYTAFEKSLTAVNVCGVAGPNVVLPGATVTVLPVG